MKIAILRPIFLFALLLGAGSGFSGPAACAEDESAVATVTTSDVAAEVEAADSVDPLASEPAEPEVTAPLVLQEEDPLAAMVGESLPYDISFLWFNRLAHARLSFVPGQESGTYRATLDTNTRGLAATLTRNRSDVFSSVMERLPDGRLRSLVYESQTTRGRGSSRATRISRYTYNYAEGEIYRDRIRGGEQSREVYEMPEDGFFNDVLTAFYNFRAGYFGEIVPGGRYEIPTFTRHGSGSIIVQVYAEGHRPFGTDFPSSGILCRVEIDEEIFDTGDGDVYVWFDDLGRPAIGVVENVLNVGDVRGRLL
ncbi:Protein of unknown function [Geoalkalibacter ferrihydriticus]|uniref:DUF3108 domain-containing protein n=2 Tax=Geoalkalibacter ferrihydriticus TaxID=392333 RepID=A0A0C2HQ40_9BACT|nr:DUF3108 domain-containing protein [Geoalkalibacter ferrihydriticus]KIH77015.1 hypothetical protein GFER_08130 [Geoalkalibacter ferrihydriticus DSM 17813]SDL38961.1 Protein of unknown function [Geoalkalibacter ferrihydriticus]